MEPMITPPPVLRGSLLYGRDSNSGNSSRALDTCGYLSGDYASPLTCGSGYTCSTGPSLFPSHLGCCNAVDCAPSSGAHTCITAESGTTPCTSSSSTLCIEQWTSLLFCTNPTAPACITYSQPPPSTGSYAGDTILSYSCGPTQTTHAWLATATNAPASAATHTPLTISNLPTWAYICIGIGGLIVLSLVSALLKKLAQPSYSIFVFSQPRRPAASPYHCRHCWSTNLKYDTVKAGNPNGNFGRPYYVCDNPLCPNVTRPDAPQHFRGWVTWADNVGMAPTNPPCHCGPDRNAREDVAGVGSGAPGKHFWTCATGACGYTSWRKDGTQGWGEGF